MTGSTVIRLAVARICRLDVDNDKFLLRSPFLLSHMQNIRDLAINLHNHPNDTNSSRFNLDYHLTKANTRVQSLKINFESFCEYTIPDDLAPLDSYFPNLRELLIAGNSYIADCLRPQSIKKFPSSLTRLIAPKYFIDYDSIILLPDSITDLNLKIRGKKAPRQRDLNLEWSRSEAPIGFPSNLTSVSTFFDGHSSRIYESLPPSVTELRLMAHKSDCPPPWELLPPNLSLFASEYCHVTGHLISMLPSRLLVVELRMRERLEIKDLLALPPTLTYLAFFPLFFNLMRDEKISFIDVLEALPPRLTGLKMDFPHKIQDFRLPTLKLELRREDLRRFYANEVAVMSQEGEGGEKMKNRDFERLRIELPTTQRELESATKGKSESPVKDLRYARWIVPERFKEIRCTSVCSAESLISVPKTTSSLSIAPVNPENLKGTTNEPERWTKARKHIKLRLPRMKSLYVTHQSQELCGIVDDINAPLETLAMPLSLVSVKPNFPTTLRYARFSELYVFQPQTSDICPISVDPTTLINALPPSLSLLSLGKDDSLKSFFPLSLPLITSRLPNLTHLKCQLEGENIGDELFEMLPRSLESLEVSIQDDKYVPSTDFARYLPRSIKIVCIQHYNDPNYTPDCDALLRNTDFFIFLPKGIDQFRIGTIDIIAKRYRLNNME